MMLHDLLLYIFQWTVSQNACFLNVKASQAAFSFKYFRYVLKKNLCIGGHSVRNWVTFHTKFCEYMNLEILNCESIYLLFILSANSMNNLITTAIQLTWYTKADENTW